MYIASAITNFVDLQSWFESLTKHGYWSIYRGNDKKPGERTASITYDNLENGWQALQNALAIQTNAGGGLFTIYVANSEKDTSGFTTRFSSAISLNGFPAAQQNGQIGSVENIGSIVEKAVTERIAAYEKDREIQDLQQEIVELKKSKRSKGISGLLNQFGELLEENQNLANMITPIIHGFAAKFLGNNLPVAPAINGTGITHSFSNDTEEENSMEYSEDDMNRLANCINELGKHFEDPISLLEKFTQFVQKDPAMAKSILNSFLK